jgi:hypothetical protein
MCPSNPKNRQDQDEGYAIILTNYHLPLSFFRKAIGHSLVGSEILHADDDDEGANWYRMNEERETERMSTGQADFLFNPSSIPTLTPTVPFTSPQLTSPHKDQDQTKRRRYVSISRKDLQKT